MTAKDCEGVAAVGMFVTVIWPFVRRHFFSGDMRPGPERALRFVLIGVYGILIAFTLKAIQLAHLDATIQPGFLKFCVVVFVAMVLRHVYKLVRPGYEVLHVPSHANIQVMGGATWIAIPDSPPEPTVMDAPLTEFNVRALNDLVDSLACEIGPMHPHYFRGMDEGHYSDGRSLFDYVPGNWSEPFWQGAANYLMAEGWTAFKTSDEEPSMRDRGEVAAAVLIAISQVFPEIQGRFLHEVSVNPALAEFVSKGYGTYLDFYGSSAVPAVESLVGTSAGESEGGS